MRDFTLVVIAVLLNPVLSSASNPIQQNPIRKTSVATSRYAQLPLIFEANRGQASADADFISRGPGYNVLMNARKITLALLAGKARKEDTGVDQIVIEILDGDRNCRMHGVGALRTETNYFVGNQPGNWSIGVRTYSKVKYDNVYPGIDLIFYGSGRDIEYDFIVHAGADYRNIKLSLQGEGEEIIEKDGSLAMATRQGAIRFRSPVIYQEGDKGKKNVQGRFVLSASSAPGVSKTLSFDVPS